jgi:sulfite reductase alpha subunit-like flavoprotein
VKGVMTGKLKYAMVCVGDTNLLLDRQTTTAKDCNQAGITLDSALTFLGAESLCNRCLTNDAVGIEESLHPWRESKLWPALKKALLPEAAGAKEEEAEKEEKEAEKELLILYGSQTGNSMEIAKQIGGECPANGVKARVMAMEQVKMTYFFSFRPCDNSSAGSSSRTH